MHYNQVWFFKTNFPYNFYILFVGQKITYGIFFTFYKSFKLSLNFFHTISRYANTLKMYLIVEIWVLLLRYFLVKNWNLSNTTFSLSLFLIDKHFSIRERVCVGGHSNNTWHTRGVGRFAKVSRELILIFETLIWMLLVSKQSCLRAKLASKFC